MADSSPTPAPPSAPLATSRDATHGRLGRGSTTSTPRWVKAFVVAFIVLVLVFVILHLTGHGFGDHLHVSAIEHGGQSL